MQQHMINKLLHGQSLVKYENLMNKELHNIMKICFNTKPSEERQDIVELRIVGEGMCIR